MELEFWKWAPLNQIIDLSSVLDPYVVSGVFCLLALAQSVFFIVSSILE